MSHSSYFAPPFVRGTLSTKTIPFISDCVDKMRINKQLCKRCRWHTMRSESRLCTNCRMDLKAHHIFQHSTTIVQVDMGNDNTKCIPNVALTCIHGVVTKRRYQSVVTTNPGPDQFDCACDGKLKQKRANATSIKKYGVPNPMQNPAVRHRSVAASFKIKKYEWDEKEDTLCHGYDPRLFDYLRTIFTEGQIDVTGDISFPYSFRNENRSYFPDAIAGGTVYEAKSEYTMWKDRNLTRIKADAVLSGGYNYHLLVFDTKTTFHRFIYSPGSISVVLSPT